MEGFHISIIFYFVLAIVCGFFVFTASNQVEDLGQAICEERYNADYVSYIDGVLECSKPIETTIYDGIKIKLVED